MHADLDVMCNAEQMHAIHSGVTAHHYGYAAGQN